ncbi:LLM class flavin-dependent oxidoreductase [Paenibacillus sp. NEAU-GSW1]|uniref:LLM class flavin-dependent oxidoreductase n=1 Tax=Paenibacillus sp. NEAU-GSW1 TaxID=2682486 RepID=UPI0012E2749B|nr:LLM class flavin-dependent oxidoreductase [Paenibacillus sp. NEAU-GSW1]MUT66949.1 LLM class flavin-dependent oxidoreductase [Paenibacillus sp. NEAU-GSW1]
MEHSEIAGKPESSQPVIPQQQESAPFEFGIYTLGDLSPDPHTGQTASAQQRIREVIDAAKLADEAGIDVFGVGEHHRLDFAISSPPVLLAAIAQATKQIRLTSATTVLGTADPVRVFEDFATLDLLSNGRAEMIAGRGAYVESFPLFGYELDSYAELFREKLELFLQLNENERVTWDGNFRSALSEAEIAPRPAQRQLPIWLGVGGTPASAALAGQLGAGMALAILGGDMQKFQPLVEAYRQAGAKAGHALARLPVGITGHCYIADSSQQAREEFYPHYAYYFSHFMGNERPTREQFNQLTAPDMGLVVGSADEVTEKILLQHELFGHTRFLAQFDIGAVPYAKVAHAIELLAVKVAPVVRREIAKKQADKTNL